MHSLNPFLRAFFQSTRPSQCVPVNHHILLVPTTECLLTGRDRETGSTYVELAASDDFLASHVLRMSESSSPGSNTVRESRGKAKQFTTINGRTVVIKESFVYSNKGFKNLNQAQLLTDGLYYPDNLDAQQWLVYYISRPLTGSYEPIKITPATLPNLLQTINSTGEPGKATSKKPVESASLITSDKKYIKSFSELLNSFPMIARQMHPGLEKVLQYFHKDMHDRPLNLSRSNSDHSRRSSTASTSSKTNGSIHSKYSNGHPKSQATKKSRVDEEENHVRNALESAVTAAIGLFQQIDKQQLSLLGTTTDLTGPTIERLIERYVTEQLHESTLFPILRDSRKLEDLELQSRIHGMQHIDIGQVGIVMDNGRQSKDRLMQRITKGVAEFRQLGVAGSPQQMIEILLATQKVVASDQLDEADRNLESEIEAATVEPENIPPPLTMNADTLVSLLLVVVIRSQVQCLQARLAYMRNFVFVDDVESGEMGYALSTFEAVLSYLASDSGGLRKASRRNQRLWQAVRNGEIPEIREILDPEHDSETLHNDESDLRDVASEVAVIDSETGSDKGWYIGKENDDSFKSQRSYNTSENGYASEGSTLAHIFPFETAQIVRKSKRVSMDLRSLSNASEGSFISRANTVDSRTSCIEGDVSIETLAQTQNSQNDSVLMMAVEARQPRSLDYLISSEQYFPIQFILEDTNAEGTTLLSAAVQSANRDLVEILLRQLTQVKEKIELSNYLAKADERGRTVAHYVFNAPYLISRFCDALPWRKKDKNGQTPLLTICRSYDHPEYADMLNKALQFATYEQGDGQPLHLDEHVDTKGNTLLHVVNDSSLAARILKNCDSDANATNDKKFTPLMVASKYGRMDMVRVLFGDNRVDASAKESRGMAAVELAKDDEIRNRIDDMVLVSNVPAADGRVTAVVRSFFVEDGSIRLIIKSALRNESGMIGVTTCRRSLTDFENLAKWLSLEHPASWLPAIFNFRSPFQIPSKPSRAVLHDIQVRLDKFLKIMLAHSLFSTHELLWEFILFPEIQPDMMVERSRKKAEIRNENIREEYEPIEDIKEVSTFVEHARDSIRGINHSTKSVMRRTTNLRVGFSNVATSLDLSAAAFATLPFLPESHITALSKFAQTTHMPSTSCPYRSFHEDMHAVLSTILAILSSLARPNTLITSLQTHQRAIDRHDAALRRSTSDRWPSLPLGLLDETRKNIQTDARERLERSHEEWKGVACELRYTQQTVAGELAGWQDLHVKLGRRAVRQLAEKMVVREKDRLEGMKRAVRGVVGVRS